MKYIPIKQKPYCCVPACIQMILKRNNLPIFNQKIIGNDLGLNKTVGTQVQKDKYSINNFFTNNNLPLTFEYYYLEDDNDIINIIKDNIKNDIIICFNYAILYNEPIENYGHVALVDHIDNHGLIILDTYNSNDLVTISIDKLVLAIKYHSINNYAGIWIIKPTNP